MRTPFVIEVPNLMWRRGVYLGVSHASHSKTAEFQRFPIFGGSFVIMTTLHPLAQNDQIRHGNIYEERRILRGQPRHCICTSASRGLSATAEFLVH